jgi:HPt (histidine-containing phosphotransfer) domain-containing protein
MTANVMKDDISHYLASGMNDHIPKPLEKEELIKKILRHIDHEKIGARNSVEPIASTRVVHHESKSSDEVIEPFLKIADNEPITDTRFLESFAGNDIQKQKKYIALFLDNAPKLLTQLQNGLNNKDFSQVKIAAHSLKTQFNYMGVKEELSHVQEMEHMAGRNENMDVLIFLNENLQKVAAKAFDELQARISD